MKLLIGGKSRNIYMRKDGSAYYKSGGENVDVSYMFKKNGGGLKKQYIGEVQDNLGKVERTKRLKRKNKLFLGGTITFGAITVDSQKFKKDGGSFFELSDFTGDAGQENFTKFESACDEMIKLCQIYMNYIHERFNNIDNDEKHVSELKLPIYPNRDLTKLQVLNIIDAAFLLDNVYELAGNKSKVIKITNESSNFNASVFLNKMKTKNERAKIIENKEAKSVRFEYYDMKEKKIITGSIYECYPNQLFYYSQIIYSLCNYIGTLETGINENIIVFIKHVYESLFEKANIGETQEKTQTAAETQTELAQPGQQAAASTAAPAPPGQQAAASPAGVLLQTPTPSATPSSP